MDNRILKSKVLSNGYQVAVQELQLNDFRSFAVTVMDTYEEWGDVDILYASDDLSDESYKEAEKEFDAGIKEYTKLRKNSRKKPVRTFESMIRDAAAGEEEHLLQEILNEIENDKEDFYE